MTSSNSPSPPSSQPVRISFAKTSLSFSDQLLQLQNRGMVFLNPVKTLKLFEHINYYRLEAYWYTYYDKSNSMQGHVFYTNTHFKDVWRDYRFDRRLREHISHALEKIEISIRTQFVYHVSQTYGPFPLEKKNFRMKQQNWAKLIKELENTCAFSNEQFAQHLRSKYSEKLFPIWALAELLSFGKIERLYLSLRDIKIKKKISATYGLEYFILESWLNHLKSVRNYCAHHSRLWNRRFTITPRQPAALNSDFDSHWIQASQIPNQQDPKNDRRLYNTLLMIDYFLSQMCPKNHWKEELVNLIKKYQIDTPRMGFPNNWETDPFWQSH